VLEILPNEVRETVNLYLDGNIDQFIVRVSTDSISIV